MNIIRQQQGMPLTPWALPGMIARSGKWPLKNWSFDVTFLYPTANLPCSHSITLSTSKKGYLQWPGQVRDRSTVLSTTSSSSQVNAHRPPVGEDLLDGLNVIHCLVVLP